MTENTLPRAIEPTEKAPSKKAAHTRRISDYFPSANIVLLVMLSIISLGYYPLVWIRQQIDAAKNLDPKFSSKMSAFSFKVIRISAIPLLCVLYVLLAAALYFTTWKYILLYLVVLQVTCVVVQQYMARALEGHPGQRFLSLPTPREKLKLLLLSLFYIQHLVNRSHGKGE